MQAHEKVRAPREVRRLRMWLYIVVAVAVGAIIAIVAASYISPMTSADAKQFLNSSLSVTGALFVGVYLVAAETMRTAPRFPAELSEQDRKHFWVLWFLLALAVGLVGLMFTVAGISGVLIAPAIVGTVVLIWGAGFLVVGFGIYTFLGIRQSSA